MALLSFGVGILQAGFDWSTFATFPGSLGCLKMLCILGPRCLRLHGDSTRQRAEDDREFSAAAADGFADHLHGDAGGTCYLKISILI